MHGLTLVIGSKNGSSWSLRPWLLLRQTGIAFKELLIPLRQADTAARIRRHSPSGKVPVLLVGELRIWDSLAIAEYLAEREPSLWPADPGVRAVARSISAEMHSGFAALRTFLPMDFTARFGPPGKLLTPVAADIRRVAEIWAECRREHARARAVPVRLVHHRRRDVRTCLLALRDLRRAAAPAGQAYVADMMALPAMLEWGRGAAAEVAMPEIAAPMIQWDEVGRRSARAPARRPAAGGAESGARDAGSAKGGGRAGTAASCLQYREPEPEPNSAAAGTTCAAAASTGHHASRPRRSSRRPSCAMCHARSRRPIMVKPIGDGTRRRR